MPWKALAVNLSQLTTRNAMSITGRCTCCLESSLQGFGMAALHFFYHLHVQESFDEEHSLRKFVQIPSGQASAVKLIDKIVEVTTLPSSGPDAVYRTYPGVRRQSLLVSSFVASAK